MGDRRELDNRGQRRDRDRDRYRRRERERDRERTRGRDRDRRRRSRSRARHSYSDSSSHSSRERRDNYRSSRHRPGGGTRKFKVTAASPSEESTDSSAHGKQKLRRNSSKSGVDER